MIFSMSNIAWDPNERLAVYSAMAEAGVAGLEIAPGLLFHDAEDPFTPDAASAARALDELRAHGLTLVSMQSLLFGVQKAALFGGPEARNRLEAGLERAIDLGARFEIPNLVFGSPKQRNLPDGLSRDVARDKAAVMFRRLGDRAVSAGCILTIEANPAVYGTNFLNTLDETDVFVTEVAHPGIRLILDLGAMSLNGEAAVTVARVPIIADRLNHVHVSEPMLAPAPADPAALARVLTALGEQAYGGAVSIEMKRPENGITDIRNCLAALKTAREAAT